MYILYIIGRLHRHLDLEDNSCFFYLHLIILIIDYSFNLQNSKYLFQKYQNVQSLPNSLVEINSIH